MQILVLGMHRSGTSMVTRLLNLMGAYFGPEGSDVGASRENPKGFWERRDVLDLHEDVLRAVDSDWYRVAHFDLDTLPEHVRADFEIRAKKIQLDLDAHTPWVMKDPRLCLLFPLWRPLLKNPVCVLVHRPPLQVGQSLKTRDGFPIVFGMALWEKYTQSALAGSAGLPRVLLAHQAVVRDPVGTAEKLYRALSERGVQGLRLPEPAEILAFVDPSLHREQGDETLQMAFLTEPQRRLWTAMMDESALLWESPPALSPGACDTLACFAGGGQALRSLSKDVRQLSRWMDEMAQDTESVFRSRRWRLGCAASDISRMLHFQPSVLVPEEARIKAVMEGYRRWVHDALATGPSRPREQAARGSPLSPPHEQQSITIIIPVFNAYDETKNSIESVLRHTSCPYDLCLIDDASTDARIWPLLSSYANAHAHVKAVRNPQNRGYTETVNAGLRLAGSNDAVLLNSDTQVTARWLEKLVAAARSADNVATVTPLSNAAGAFSVPTNNVVNAIPDSWSVDDMGNMVERLSRRLYPRVPTGNGYCMYVTRKALDTVGLFDVEHFPKGYGEENDFCMRASAKGFIHLIDDATFIYHKRTASFGKQKHRILPQSKAMLDRLHPAYRQRVKDWLDHDPLNEFRGAIKAALTSRPQGMAPSDRIGEETPPLTILYILHNGAGGTLHTSEDLVSEIARHFRCLLLKTDLDRWRLYRYQSGMLYLLGEYVFPDNWLMPATVDADRMDCLYAICADFQVGLVHVRHLLANGPEIIMGIKRIGIPVVFSFHDFYTVCPTIHLRDDQGNHCGGHCTPGDGVCPVSAGWIRNPPHLKHRYVHVWRERVAQVLRLCDACVTTSRSAYDLIVAHFPFLSERFFIIEHGRDFDHYRFCAAPPGPPPIAIVLFGAFGAAKGTSLIEALMRVNAHNQGPFQFHVLGDKARDFKPEDCGGIYHGSYERETLPKFLEKISPSFSMISSVWSETFCHTLTESWAAGIPVLATDMGALRDRIRQHGGGWLIPDTDPTSWYGKMMEILQSPTEYGARLNEVHRMKHKTVREMAEEYLSLYARVAPAFKPGAMVRLPLIATVRDREMQMVTP